MNTAVKTMPTITASGQPEYLEDRRVFLPDDIIAQNTNSTIEILLGFSDPSIAFVLRHAPHLHSEQLAELVAVGECGEVHGDGDRDVDEHAQPN